MTLDHVGLVVADLDRAAAFAEALGFTLTRRAEFKRRDPDGVERSAGGAQRSIMLAQGYVELQQITDLESGHPLAPAARRYFGLHVVAFGVPDAAAAHETCRAAGLAVDAPRRWSRPLDEPDLSGEARFHYFVSAYGAADEALLVWVEHETPARLRSPRLIRHVNGCDALLGIVVATESDGDTLAARYRRGGGTPVAARPGRLEFDPGWVDIVPRAALPPMLAEASWPAADWVAAAVLRTGDAGGIAARATAAGCPVSRSEGSTIVDARAPLGCLLIFQEDRASA